MTDNDLAALFGRYGVDTSLGDDVGDDRPPLPLSPVGERLRGELLRHLGAARASIEMLEVTARDNPNNDAAFDAIDAAFDESLAAARAAFERFRGLRECAGEV